VGWEATPDTAKGAVPFYKGVLAALREARAVPQAQLRGRLMYLLLVRIFLATRATQRGREITEGEGSHSKAVTGRMAGGEGLRDFTQVTAATQVLAALLTFMQAMAVQQVATAAHS